MAQSCGENIGRGYGISDLRMEGSRAQWLGPGWYPGQRPFFFFKDFFFLMWTIFFLKSLLNLFIASLLRFGFFGREACGILTPQPGIKPAHWTIREVPQRPL